MGDSDNDQQIYLPPEWRNRAGTKPAAFDFAENLIYILIFLPLIILILRALNSGPFAYYSLALLPVNLFLVTLLRIRCKKIWIFIVLTPLIAVSAAAAYIIAGNYPCVAAALTAAVVSSVKLHTSELRYKANIERTPMPEGNAYLGKLTLFLTLLLFIVEYFALFFMNAADLIPLLFISYAAIFAVMAIYRYKSGSFCFSQWNKIRFLKSSGNSFSGLMFSVFTVLGTLFAAFILYIAGRLSGLSRLDGAIVNEIRKMLGIRFKINAVDQPKKQYGGMKFKDIKAKGTGSFPWAVIGLILKIIFTILAAAAVIAVLFLLVKAIIRIFRKLGRNVNEERRSLFSVEDAGAELKRQARRLKNHIGMFGGSSRDRIRRLFYLHVKRHGSGAVLKGSDSPFEINGKIGTKRGRLYSAATEIYEKARYGCDGCNDDDVKRMKDALK